jgi:hypothetical protein
MHDAPALRPANAGRPLPLFLSRGALKLCANRIGGDGHCRRRLGPAS